MYNFIDTTEVSEVALLPSEALRINGQYIENLIQGYRTLNVTGREALSAELDYFETGIRDGSKLKSKRYPARIITVAYQLIAESSEAFREAYNKLGQILNVKNAELIFNDELDKFFIGTPETIGAVPPGRNAVTGEFEILCLDPFKYSVVEKETLVNIADKSALIDYNGTYKSYPVFETVFFDESEDGENEKEITGNGDCGFISFFDEGEHIIQLGDPAEIDGEKVPNAQTLINQTFLSDTAWGTTAKRLWTMNNGHLMQLNSAITQTGTVGMYTKEHQKAYLTATSYGSGDAWHGPSITRQIGADAAGDVGATNFHFYSEICIARYITATGTLEKGSMQVQIADANGKNVAGIRIVKSKTGKASSLIFYVNGKVVNETDLDLNFSSRNKSFYIRKNGANIQFNFNSYMRHYTDAAIADMKATQVTFSFEQYRTAKPLSHIGVSLAKFTKNLCDTWHEIPNKFTANDVLEVDCKEGKVYLNGLEAPELGALGNDWEDFYLTPGLNQIGVAYSDWVTDDHAPTIKVKYREVFL